MKKLILGAFLFCSALSLPPVSHAQSPFGGLDVFTMPCTCGFTYNYHYFAPLYFGAVPLTGPMVALVTPTLFSYHTLHPGAWALGFKTTPGACWMWAGNICYPIPTLGFITPYTGTSL